ncbi:MULTISPECIES: hypothetical protein [Frankia]|uniref:hypothetical protein n=1 Tax=Frankia TaxID=1854 RepID=UPI0006EBFB5A|nr:MULTISPECIES: hypothetical protein [Frankia]
MSPLSGCSACWSDGDVTRLLAYAEGRIAAATAHLWPQAQVAFGPMVTGGSAVVRRVQVDGETLCATLHPRGATLASVVRGDHGDLTAVLTGDDGPRADRTDQEAEQLTALAVYSGLRIAAPAATADGVLFTRWVTGTSLAGRVQARPAVLTELLMTLMDDLTELHRDPAGPLRQAAAPTGPRALPRVVTEALSHPTDHLHPQPPYAGEVSEAKALTRSLAARLARLASALDPVLLARAGVAFGALTPTHVLYPASAPGAVLVSPALGPGGEPADTGTLLGHLHLIALDCPPPIRSEIVEGVEAWLAGRLATRRGEWRGWLAAVLTIWAATVYDTVATALTLSADALPLEPFLSGLPRRPLPALAGLDVLTRTLRRHGADAALNATLSALAADPTSRAGSDPAQTTPPR